MMIWVRRQSSTMARAYRTILLGLALAVQLAAPLAAQPDVIFHDAQANASEGPQTAVIEGTVLNTQNNRSIPRASVTLNGMKGAGSRSARADGSGHFLFQQVEPGAYRLTAERQGFFSDERKREFQPVVEVSAGQHLKNVPVRLMPTAVVAGEILDEYNDPIQNVEVKLLSVQARLGRMFLRTAGNAVTDDRGQYRISGLRPGRYYVVAEYRSKTIRDNILTDAAAGMIDQMNAEPGRKPVRVQLPQKAPDPPYTYPSLFYPATSDFQQAQSLVLNPGDETSANFLFISAPLATIRGRVTNGMTGEPAGKASVSAFWTQYMEGDGLTARVHPESGAFEIKGVAPGLYTLRASAVANSVNYAGETTVQVGVHGADNVELVVLPDFAAAGRVKIEGTPVTRGSPMGRVTVEFVGEGLMPRVLARAAFPDFKFDVQLRPEKRYHATIRNLPEDYYLKSLSISGHEVAPDQVVLSGTGGSLELVLSPSGGRLDGVLFDSQDQPARGSILLVPDAADPGPPELFRRSRADAQGKFTLRGIPPGSYRLLALDSLDLEAEINTPEFQRSLGNRGQHVLVEENGKYAVTVKLE